MSVLGVRVVLSRRAALAAALVPLLAGCAGNVGASTAGAGSAAATSDAVAPTSTSAPSQAASDSGVASSSVNGAATTSADVTSSSVGNSATARSGATDKVALVFPGPGTLIFLPFEVARAQGFFASQGVDASFTYAKGGPPAVTALLANSTDFVGTTIDLALNSYKQHKTITMVASLTRLPAFAVVSAGPSVTSLKQLAGKKVAITNVGAGDQLVLEFLLKQQSVDPASVQYVAVGPDEAKINAIKAKQVDAAILQEPALSIVKGLGGQTLANLYDPAQAKAAFGGGYQFTGLVTRPDVIKSKGNLTQRMVNAVVQADRFIAAQSGDAIVAKLPDQAIVGGDKAAFAKIVDQYKAAIYSADGLIHADEVNTVAKVQAASGALTGATPDMTQFYTNTFVDAAPK